MSEPVVLLSGQKFEITLDRLCFQLIENHKGFENSALIGLQPRGIYLAKALHARLIKFVGNKNILFGTLDATFHRDDFKTHKGPLIPSAQSLDFQVEGKNIILIDDVLYTGRTIRAGMDALIDYGRPEKIELLVLVDRRYSRQLPIEPNYTGIAVDARTSQKVKVSWEESDNKNSVKLMTEE
jgi:pyrimidine operon attenuation protein/uracil phosphoribosyltransferase